ncbi:hypothetical protein B0J13DRAFT_219505 [Dactylonectria estremocensis]|uniref:SET domain-containing protein n=1 Tax=Dactylonectria estremocensis TaxID=1079267 RepID=A0A9P9JC37_9HYPO|nr:hypothetical protein B0J13DRAFT_219505 [Dactylonectria estremocensis]
MKQSTLSLRGCLVLSVLAYRPIWGLTEWKNEGLCAWDPVTPLLETRFCELQLDTTTRTLRQNETEKARFVNTEWKGPHGCAEGFCLYSNPGFYSGRGIVAITPEILLPALKKLRSQPEGIDTPENYHVEKVPGKGLGVMADGLINRGDVVMPRPPAFLAHKRFLEDHATSPEQNALLEKGLSLLPEKTAKLFLSQMAHMGGHRINDIFMTNGYQVVLDGQDSHHYGSYPEISRVNHDCRPNLAYYIDEDFVHRTRAARRIEPGEELTVTYLNPFMLRDARKRRAHNSWGFDCQCPQCSLSDALAHQSDGRLRRIDELEPMMENLEKDITMGDIREMMEIYEKERMDIKLAGPLTLAAMNANLLGQATEAREYAKRAAEAGIIERGESEDVKSMRLLAKDPKGHFTWRGRVTENGLKHHKIH